MKIATKKLSKAEPFLAIADEKPVEGLRKHFRIGRQKTLGLLKSSYPVLHSGSGGSGRSHALASIVSQNIKDGVPFAYISGRGDVSLYQMYYSISARHQRLDDLYIINFIGIGHTFDPINPNIGDERYFKTIFGEKFGSVLHEIFLCEKLNNKIVGLSDIKSYLLQKNLLEMLDQEKYQSAEKSISNFMTDSIEEREQAMKKTKCFVEIMERSSVFSTIPDVDLQKLFDRNKFLHINLPNVDKLDPMDREVLLSMFGYLLSKIEIQNGERDAYCSIILDDCLSQTDIDEHILLRLSAKNTIFSYYYYPHEDGPGYKTFRTITRASNSVINMKTEIDCGIPDVLMVSAINHGLARVNIRCIKHQPVGQCLAWGLLGIDNGDSRIVGSGYFKLRFVAVNHVENISLNAKPM